MGCVLEHKRSGLVDGDRARPGCWIGMLSSVKCDRVETRFSFQKILPREVVYVTPNPFDVILSVRNDSGPTDGAVGVEC